MNESIYYGINNTRLKKSETAATFGVYRAYNNEIRPSSETPKHRRPDDVFGNPYISYKFPSFLTAVSCSILAR